MDLNLDDMNMEDLKLLRADVDKAISTSEDRRRAAALAAAQEVARQHGLELSDLMKGNKSKKAATSIAPKYMNPADNSQTWTGRGRKPRWVEEALAAGGSIDDFLISSPVPQPAPVEPTVADPEPSTGDTTPTIETVADPEPSTGDTTPTIETGDEPKRRSRSRAKGDEASEAA